MRQKQFVCITLRFISKRVAVNNFHTYISVYVFFFLLYNICKQLKL